MESERINADEEVIYPSYNDGECEAEKGCNNPATCYINDREGGPCKDLCDTCLGEYRAEYGCPVLTDGQVKEALAVIEDLASLAETFDDPGVLERADRARKFLDGIK